MVLRIHFTLTDLARTRVAAKWDEGDYHVQADRLRRLQAFADGGCEAMLASFRPLLRWHPPTLETDHPADRDLYLEGRGLLLVPTFFGGSRPVTVAAHGRQPVLMYPIDRDLAAAPIPATPSRRVLDRLVGRTRSAVLRCAEDSCGTSELARRCGISAASASQHASVLRDAGLVLTQRRGGSVVHSLTSLGAAVLNGRVSTIYPE